MQTLIFLNVMHFSYINFKKRLKPFVILCPDAYRAPKKSSKSKIGSDTLRLFGIVCRHHAYKYEHIGTKLHLALNVLHNCTVMYYEIEH